MQLDKAKVDSWLIKGLDGGTDQLLELSGKVEVKLNIHQLILFHNTIGILESVLNFKQDAFNTDLSQILLASLAQLVELLRKRTFEMGYGPFGQADVNNLKEYLHRLKVAYNHFQERAA